MIDIINIIILFYFVAVGIILQFNYYYNLKEAREKNRSLIEQKSHLIIENIKLNDDKKIRKLNDDKKISGVIFEYILGCDSDVQKHKLITDDPDSLLIKINNYGCLKYLLDNCFRPSSNLSIKLIEVKGYKAPI